MSPPRVGSVALLPAILALTVMLAADRRRTGDYLGSTAGDYLGYTTIQTTAGALYLGYTTQAPLPGTIQATDHCTIANELYK